MTEAAPKPHDRNRNDRNYSEIERVQRQTKLSALNPLFLEIGRLLFTLQDRINKFSFPNIVLKNPSTNETPEKLENPITTEVIDAIFEELGQRLVSCLNEARIGQFTLTEEPSDQYYLEEALQSGWIRILSITNIDNQFITFQLNESQSIQLKIQRPTFLPQSQQNPNQEQIRFFLTSIELIDPNQNEPQYLLPRGYFIDITCTRQTGNDSSSFSINSVVKGSDITEEQEKQERRIIELITPLLTMRNKNDDDDDLQSLVIDDELVARLLGQNEEPHLDINPFNIEVTTPPDCLMEEGEAIRILREYIVADPNNRKRFSVFDTKMPRSEDYEIITIRTKRKDGMEGQLAVYVQKIVPPLVTVLGTSSRLISSAIILIPIQVVNNTGNFSLIFLHFTIYIEIDLQTRQVKLRLNIYQNDYRSLYVAHTIFVNKERRSQDSAKLEIIDRITELLNGIVKKIKTTDENDEDDEDETDENDKKDEEDEGYEEELASVRCLKDSVEEDIDLSQIEILFSNLNLIDQNLEFIKAIADVIRNTYITTDQAAIPIPIPTTETERDYSEDLKKAFKALKKEFNIRGNISNYISLKDPDMNKFINILAIYIFIKFAEKQGLINTDNKHPDRRINWLIGTGRQLIENLNRSLKRGKIIWLGTTIQDFVSTLIFEGKRSRRKFMSEIEEIIPDI